MKIFLLKLVVLQSFLLNLILSQDVSNQQIQEFLKESGISVPNSEIQKQIQDMNTSNVVAPNSNEIDKEGDLIIKEEIKNLQKNNISNNSVIKKSTETEVDELYIGLEEEKDVEEKDVEDKDSESVIGTYELENTISTYFGYSTFQTNPEVFTKSTDLSVSPDYVIGPGDEIIIMLWGQTEDLDTYTVTKDGYIFINNIGQVFVNGLNLERLEIKLKNIFKKSYSSISPDNNRSPTFFDVSLGSIVLKPIRVFVMGEVENPGAYEMLPSSTLFSSLYYFNGPKISGSLRDIHLIRNGKKIASIDFYDFLLKGLKNNDQKLKDGDVIFIPSRKKTVHVSGEVKRSSIFELLENENFNELKEFFGGYLVTTYLKRARLDRINSIKDRLISKQDRIIIDINLLDHEENNKNIKVLDGDKFMFTKISEDYQNAVTISGPVKRPGLYSLSEPLTILDLIKKSDGISSGDIYPDRVDLIRKLPDGKESFFSFNLDSIMENNPKHNVKLIAFDSVVLYRLSDKLFSNDVRIEGFVKSPGIKQYRQGMTLFDLIFLGGGFQNSDFLGDTYLERADLFRYDESSKKYILKSFNLGEVLAGKGNANDEIKMSDRVVIYSKEQIIGEVKNKVEISGFVSSPGSYDYVENMDIRDILFMASGYTDKKRANKLLFGRADLLRINSNLNDRFLIRLDLEKILENETKYLLKPGDEIKIYSKDLFEKKKNVTITGMVNRPATYELADNLNLRDIILKAGGFKGENKSYRIEISSFINSSDGTLSSHKTHMIDNVEASFINQKNTSLNTLLKPKDFISVFAQGIEDHHTVEVKGEVLFPGTYVLQNRNVKLSEIINRAGGPTAYANEVATFVERDNETIAVRYDKVSKRKKSKYNIQLVDGDILTFKRKLNTVTVKGEVRNPGVFQYVDGLKAKDYIRLAGGFNKDAAKYQSSVIHPNGFSEKIGLIGDKMIFDGSEINVPAKEQVEKFSFTEYATNLTSIYTDIVQAVTLITLLGKE